MNGVPPALLPDPVPVLNRGLAVVPLPPGKKAALTGGQMFALGDVEGFQGYAALKERQSSAFPSDRTAGMVMHYT